MSTSTELWWLWEVNQIAKNYLPGPQNFQTRLASRQLKVSYSTSSTLIAVPPSITGVVLV
jgi:hypothetical protein